MLTVLGWNALQLRMVAQRPDGIIDPGLKFFEIGGRRLRPCRSKAEEDNRQQKQQLPQP
jgi:hypothetical protein